MAIGLCVADSKPLANVHTLDLPFHPHQAHHPLPGDKLWMRFLRASYAIHISESSAMVHIN